MIALGLETSCDETSVALLRDGREVLANLVSSQIDLHRTYGGVVPELACRKHSEVLNPLLQEALGQAGLTWSDLGLVCVTCGPGLVGALVVGVAAAKTLSVVLQVPLIGVNHLEGHMYGNFLERPDLKFPLLGLLVSGGHTLLLWMEGHGTYRRVGETLDDAAGEAFDKVARLMRLGYPGGPIIDQMARTGNARAVHFPRALRGQSGYDFSFSGLKTAVATFLARDGGSTPLPDVCASFQEAVVDALVTQTMRAARDLHPATVVLAGGVACNTALRARLQQACARDGIDMMYPSGAMCTDNAAMIACAGTYRFLQGETSALDLEANPSLSLPGLEISA